MPEPLITLLAGPTASGKSRLAMDMAERSGAVVVNADSQQLYADLRVLSARPSPEDEARIEHHLYGVADGADAWSVGRWSRAVVDLLATLADQHRPAIIVGGTGLYFSALTQGLADIPPVPDEVRRQAETLYDAEGEAAFRLRLVVFDPPAEAAIAAGDRQRLVRAWAVAAATDRSLSDWQASTRPLLRTESCRCLVLEPPRPVVYAACDARVERMIADGALDEVATLLARDLPASLPVMKAVGVREFGAYLAGAMTRDRAVGMTQQATRNYAKRQLTWLRNQMPSWDRVQPSH